MTKILVVDDESRIRRLVKLYLERETFIVEEAATGTEALAKAMSTDYSLLVLDVMLPEMDGLSVCKEIHKYKATPVLILSAKLDENSRIQGFESGADDYVSKPFSPRELVMRIKAVLKRYNQAGIDSLPQGKQKLTQVLVFGELSIHTESRKVCIGKDEVILTPKEFDLLCYLASQPEKVFSRDDLLRDVWHYEFTSSDQRTVDTHVKRLREKLRLISEDTAEMVDTVWGVGYRLKLKVS